MTQLVQVFFPASGGRTGCVILPWFEGMTVRHCLNHESLLSYHLLGRRRHCRLTDQNHRRLRLRTPIQPGDTVMMKRAGHVV